MSCTDYQCYYTITPVILRLNKALLYRDDIIKEPKPVIRDIFISTFFEWIEPIDGIHIENYRVLSL